MDCMGWHGRVLVDCRHVILDRFHKTLHCGLWWWWTALLVLALPIACVPRKWAKPYLGTPSLWFVIEGSEFIDKMWFHRVETILDMELVLDPLPLSLQELFNISHEVGTLRSSVAQKTAFGTYFMDALITTLYPNTIAII